VGADWRRKNVQVLLHTTVYKGTPARPEVLAVHAWWRKLLTDSVFRE